MYFYIKKEIIMVKLQHKVVILTVIFLFNLKNCFFFFNKSVFVDNIHKISKRHFLNILYNVHVI